MGRKKALTEEQIQQIRGTWEHVTMAKLAEQFDVSIMTIYKVLNYRGVYKKADLANPT